MVIARAGVRHRSSSHRPMAFKPERCCRGFTFVDVLRFFSNYSKHTRKYIDDNAFADDILIEVLKWLPVDNLFNLKCVCKRWEKIISSNYFRAVYQLHICAPDSSSSTLLGFFRSEAKVAFLPTCLKSRTNRAKPYFKTDGFYFVDSCNGLLLFHNVNEKIYRVCNPVTKQWRDIKQPYSNVNKVAVAFDVPFQEPEVESLNSFVLAFVTSDFGKLWHLYTLLPGTAFWIHYYFLADKNYFSFRHSECAVVIHGVYYWKGLLDILAWELPRSQDIDSGFVEVFPLPLRNITTIDVSSVLGVSKDGLLQYARSDSNKIVVWVYQIDNDDENKYMWVLRHTICYGQMSYHSPECSVFFNRKGINKRYTKLVAIHPSDPEIVFILINETIISYCFRNNRVELVRRIEGMDKESEGRGRYDLPWEWCRRIVPYFFPKWAVSFLGPPLVVDAN